MDNIITQTKERGERIKRKREDATKDERRKDFHPREGHDVNVVLNATSDPRFAGFKAGYF
jgi:hypothetical protein